MSRKRMNRVKFVSQLVRFTNLHVYEPKQFIEGVQSKYGLTILIPKTDQVEIQRFNRVYTETKNCNLDFFNRNEMVYGGLRDGDIGGVSCEFKECYFLNVSSIERPGIVDVDLNSIMNLDEVYNGCYGRVSITLYPYSIKGKSGIAAGLNNLQKLKDGERINSHQILDDFYEEK